MNFSEKLNSNKPDVFHAYAFRFHFLHFVRFLLLLFWFSSLILNVFVQKLLFLLKLCFLSYSLWLTVNRTWLIFHFNILLIDKYCIKSIKYNLKLWSLVDSGVLSWVLQYFNMHIDYKIISVILLWNLLNSLPTFPLF